MWMSDGVTKTSRCRCGGELLSLIKWAIHTSGPGPVLTFWLDVSMAVASIVITIPFYADVTEVMVPLSLITSEYTAMK